MWEKVKIILRVQGLSKIISIPGRTSHKSRSQATFKDSGDGGQIRVHILSKQMFWSFSKSMKTGFFICFSVTDTPNIWIHYKTKVMLLKSWSFTQLLSWCLNVCHAFLWMKDTEKVFKALWEKDKILVTTIFFFSHNWFWPVRDISYHLGHFFCRCINRSVFGLPVCLQKLLTLAIDFEW